jgi:hypothetical protein
LFALIMSALTEGRVYEVFVGTATHVTPPCRTFLCW